MPDMQARPDMRSCLSEWYRATARDLPWRRSTFHNEFGAWGVLVSEFMLQQTPVTRVIPHLDAWLARWPTPTAMATASTAEVVQQWANLGYPRRALWLHRAAVEITDRHGGVVPRDVDALLALSGIGEYTARAVAVFAYGDRHPVVDTNTRRVLARAVAGRSQPGPPSRRDRVRTVRPAARCYGCCGTRRRAQSPSSRCSPIGRMPGSEIARSTR
jgi:A/G-specific adenine glycosylase